MTNRILILILFISLFGNVYADPVKPYGQFLQDSVKVGAPIKFSLSIKYPTDWQIFFPDSTGDFGNFEFYKKHIFPTKSNDSTSLDSVVYELVSFEVDSIQVLKLPVFRFTGNDTLPIYSNEDKVIFQSTIIENPENFDLKENTEFRFIKDILDKQRLLILAGVILILTILVIVFFGKRIKAKWKVYWLRRAFDKFSKAFDSQIVKIDDEKSIQLIEQTVASWKTYLSNLEGQSYATFTSSDFAKKLNNSELSQCLRDIDKLVYGGYSDEKLKDRLIYLKHFAEDRFTIKREEVMRA